MDHGSPKGQPATCLCIVRIVSRSASGCLAYKRSFRRVFQFRDPASEAAVLLTIPAMLTMLTNARAFG